MAIKSITIKLESGLLNEINKAITYLNKKSRRNRAITKSSIIRAGLIEFVDEIKEERQGQ